MRSVVVMVSGNEKKKTKCENFLILFFFSVAFSSKVEPKFNKFLWQAKAGNLKRMLLLFWCNCGYLCLPEEEFCFFIFIWKNVMSFFHLIVFIWKTSITHSKKLSLVHLKFFLIQLKMLKKNLYVSVTVTNVTFFFCI